jgi:hypothetical protein
MAAGAYRNVSHERGNKMNVTLTVAIEIMDHICVANVLHIDPQDKLASPP